MALTVDSFDLLANEIITNLPSLRDILTLIGIYYSAKKILSLALSAVEAAKVHGFSHLSTVKFSEKFGPWAVITGSTHGIGKAFAQELAGAGLNIIVVSIDEGDCKRVAQDIEPGFVESYHVITGCTGGIGEEYCILLAKSGINLILVSRNTAKLKNLSLKIENNFHVLTEIIPVDFNDGRPVYDIIKAGIEGKDIGILVNNVGVMYDYPQCFLEVPYDKLWQLVHVNVAAATMMTHFVLPQMVEKERGAIITVSSGASALPTPLMAVYSATKAYLDYFCRALRYEYKDKGITVQCLMPFYVATRMTQYSSTLSNPSVFIPTASTYARHALRTLGWSDRTTGYWPHTIQMWLSYLIPERLWLWGALRLNSALRRQADQRLQARRRSGSRSRHASGNAGSRRGSKPSLLIPAKLLQSKNNNS